MEWMSIETWYTAKRARKASAIALLLGTIAVGSLRAEDEWPMFGENAANTASTSETTITTGKVSTLKTKWVFTTGGDVSARAAVVNGVVYFPDWGGNIWAVNASTGKKLWRHQMSDYGLPSGTVSRTSPAVVDDKVYIGTQTDGWLLAINAKTGSLIWKTAPIPSAYFPKITGAVTVADSVVYVGLATDEEDKAEENSYPCCTTKGRIVAVNANNGTVLWSTATVPTGYSGGSIWSSGPVVDESRHTVYVTTGNNYSTPTAEAYLKCVAAGGSPGACQSPEDYADSVIALNSKTGAVKWGKRLLQWSDSTDQDDFNLACRTSPQGNNCPTPTGPDLDFGSGANEIKYKTAKGSETLIGAGQKSGIYYALNPDTGAELWHTQVGPGIQWGSASDGTRIYVAVSNPGGAGSWVALDPATGKILWRTPDPNGVTDTGPLAVANGIVYAPSLAGSSTAPNMLALNAETGAKLWSFAAGSSVVAGAAIVGGDVYWGAGSSRSTAPNRFYAFSEKGK